MSKKVIKRSELPVSAPATNFCAIIAVLKAFNAPNFVWGLVICLYAMFFVAWGYLLYHEKEVSVIRTEESESV